MVRPARSQDPQAGGSAPTAVVLVPATVRASLARLVRHSVPSLSVLAYTEVPEDKRLKLVGTIS